MVYLRSRLDVADNSGARMATMIGVIGKGSAQSAGIGDVITANVKEASATGTVKKGEVVRAVPFAPDSRFGAVMVRCYALITMPSSLSIRI